MILYSSFSPLACFINVEYEHKARKYYKNSGNHSKED